MSVLPAGRNPAPPGKESLVLQTRSRMPNAADNGQHATPEQLFFQLPHIRLSALRFGQPNQPVILALHGWLDNALSFQPLAAELSGYQVIAVEWPGHGYSQHRPGKTPLHWVDYLLDLHALLSVLDEQGLKPAALLGHSMGAMVASVYSAVYPEQVPALMMIEAAGPLVEAESNIAQRLQRSLTQHNRPERALAHYADIRPLVRARHQLTGLERHWCELLIARNVQPHEQGVCWRTDPRLKLDSPVRFCLSQVNALMDKVSVPALLIVAQQGLMPLDDIRQLAGQWFAALILTQLPGNHHLHMEHASDVAGEIGAFLQSHHMTAE